MNKYEFSPDTFFEGLYAGRVSPYEGISDDEILITSEKIKKELREILSFEKIPHKISELSPQLICAEERKGYTVKTLSVEICKDWKMLCYLLLPHKGGNTGVVAVPGHGYGVRQIIRQSKNGRYRRINFFDNYQKNFAEALCLQGNTVIAFEPVAFGKARLKKDMHKPFYISSCETVSMHSLMYGFSCAALRVYQAVRCIDILSSQGLQHIGIMGISGGGLVALYTSLCDERIEKTVVSGYINTFGKSVLSMWHCTDNYIPGLMLTGDMYDYACAVAPRKLLMECGERDKLFPIEASDEAIKRISGIYNRLGAGENFIADRHKGKHQVSGKISFEFFGKE